MKIAIIVSLLIVRELFRATLAPIRMILYLPQRTRWRREIAEILAEDPQATDVDPSQKLTVRGKGRLFISAGETSGESHAVRVIQAVAAAGGEGDWQCFGGHQLEEAGAELLYPLSDRTVMGLRGVIRSLPFIIRAVTRFIRMLEEDPPDLIVLVDYPGLHLVLARLARNRGIEVIHYIAPQYWAWGPWRMKRYKKCVSATLTILPFESPFFRHAGIPSEYVGHPLLDANRKTETGTRTTAEEMATESPTLCLLPGSRRKEIQLNLPGMIQVARDLRSEHQSAHVVLPHIDPRHSELIRALLRELEADFVEFREGEVADVLTSSRVVLAKSGTGSLEACLQGVPTIVVYKLSSSIAEIFARHCLSVPWISSANLIAGRKIVPEFCFREDNTWSEVSSLLTKMWVDGPTRSSHIEGLNEIRSRLGSPGASKRVARWILPFCRIAS